MVRVTKPNEIEFNMNNEVEKIRKILRFPITKVLFDEQYEYGKLYLDEKSHLLTLYAKLFIADVQIGTIPYTSNKWGFMYSSHQEESLNWAEIYRCHENEILSKIYEQQPLSKTVEIGGLRTLNIKDENGFLINVAYCNFIKGDWNVVLGGANDEVKEYNFKVSITTPRLESEE